jgi:membrane protease YdiL (CAAX protease family)
MVNDMDLFKNIKFKNWLIFGIVLFVFLTFEFVFYFFGMDFTNLSEIDLYIMTFSKYLVLITFMVLYYNRYLKEKWHDFRKNFKTYSKIGFKDWFTGFIIMYVSNIIIMKVIGSVGQNEEAVQSMISSTPIIAFILTTILAPFLEEMIFRKSLQDCFDNKYFFMIISGLLFGFVHVLGAENALEYLLIIPYGALGFMFAHTLTKTDNIYATIMMHAFHNGILTILSIISTLVIL